MQNADKQLNPEYVKALIAAINTSPYQETLGMHLVSMEPGRCEMYADLDVSKHGNAYRGLHGGFLATMVDCATFWACYLNIEEGQGFVTLDMNVNDTGGVPGCTGRVRIIGEQVKTGRSIHIAKATAYAPSGKMIVYGTASMMVLPHVDNDVSTIFKAAGIENVPPKYL